MKIMEIIVDGICDFCQNFQKFLRNITVNVAETLNATFGVQIEEISGWKICTQCNYEIINIINKFVGSVINCINSPLEYLCFCCKGVEILQDRPINHLLDAMVKDMPNIPEPGIPTESKTLFEKAHFTCFDCWYIIEVVTKFRNRLRRGRKKGKKQRRKRSREFYPLDCLPPMKPFVIDLSKDDDCIREFLKQISSPPPPTAINNVELNPVPSTSHSFNSGTPERQSPVVVAVGKSKQSQNSIGVLNSDVVVDESSETSSDTEALTRIKRKSTSTCRFCSSDDDSNNFDHKSLKPGKNRKILPEAAQTPQQKQEIDTQNPTNTATERSNDVPPLAENSQFETKECFIMLPRINVDASDEEAGGENAQTNGAGSNSNDISDLFKEVANKPAESALNGQNENESPNSIQQQQQLNDSQLDISDMSFTDERNFSTRSILATTPTIQVISHSTPKTKSILTLDRSKNRSMNDSAVRKSVTFNDTVEEFCYSPAQTLNLEKEIEIPHPHASYDIDVNDIDIPDISPSDEIKEQDMDALDSIMEVLADF